MLQQVRPQAKVRLVDRVAADVADRRHDKQSAAELARVSSLIGCIYEAALDPAKWPDALREVNEFVGGVASALVSHDMATKQGRFYFSWGDDPHYTKLYLEKYVRLNPVIAPMMLRKVGEVCCASDVIPREELHATRFYKEWLRPAGYGDATWGFVEKSAAVMTTIATSHDSESFPVGPGARRRMELILPHVRRAVAIGNVTAMHRIDAEMLADAVDALSAGVFLIADDGRLIRANARGKDMLARADMVGVDRGMFTICGDPAARQALCNAIAEVMAGTPVVCPRGIAIPLMTRSGDRYVAHVLPLWGARQKAACSSRAAAAIFVHKAEVGGLLPLEAVARQFDLSAAELRVLVAVVEVGGSVPEIAPALGISEPTVKTHLRRLFEKTGAKRQADLVRLVAGYSSPLIGQPEVKTAI
jgi:DNA-binding CsgD family transcriptional regulator